MCLLTEKCAVCSFVFLFESSVVVFFEDLTNQTVCSRTSREAMQCLADKFIRQSDMISKGMAALLLISLVVWWRLFCTRYVCLTHTLN